MSTAPTRIKSASDLLLKTGLANTEFHNCSIPKLVTDVWDIVGKIWDSVDLRDYTDHSLSHSLRVIDYFLHFNELFKWSAYEKSLFVVAALIHDIGMQFNHWGPMARMPRHEGWIRNARLSSDEIRKRHIDTGSTLFFDLVSSQPTAKFPPNFALESPESRDFLTRAGYIAFAHSGNNLGC